MPQAKEIIHVTDVEPVEGYLIRVTFSDGAAKEVDLEGLVGSARGVFRALSDAEFFKRVRVNRETQTVEWPGEIDLDPEVLYGLFKPASGADFKRRTIREPAQIA